MSLRSRIKALSDAFVRLAEAMEGDPLEGLESRVARLERGAAAGAGYLNGRPDRPALEARADQPSV